MLERFAKITRYFKDVRPPALTAREILRYIGPGLLVTVGFIDPGNWASNVAAGADFGYTLLWMVTLSTIMLIVLQHNAAHLGIATGLCLSEAAMLHVTPWIARTSLASAVGAAVATALAEILGAAIALNMLFHIPLRIGTIITVLFVGWMLYANSYRKIEKYIIGFVSLIGIAFIFELCLVHIDWREAAVSWVLPRMPAGSIAIVMSVLGAVVMPHNLFLHSEIIQSRQWNLEEEAVIKRQLKYEFLDTLFSMVVGWGINSAMILMAAATFFAARFSVSELGQAQEMLRPLLGNAAALVFALALLFAGVSSSVTAGMASGSIFSGMVNEPYDIRDWHSKIGVGIALLGATIIIFFIKNPFKGLIVSQIMLSVQLPITIFLQTYLTSSKKVMGTYANTPWGMFYLLLTGVIVTVLNVMLLVSIL